MAALLLLAILPGLYWDQGPSSAASLRNAGIDRIYVPPAQKAAWRSTGVEASGLDISGLPKVAKPGVQYRMNQASATAVPWIDANGWRLDRDPKRTYFYDVPAAAVALAMAESYSRNTAVVIHAGSDPSAFGRMQAFLKQIDQPALPVAANIGVIDDRSAAVGETMNLLARRNLLFRVVQSPDPKLDLNLKPSARDAANPFLYVQDVRQKLGDEKRLVRLYGSEVVLANLTAEGDRARLFLINYSDRKVAGLRVRVRGAYRKAALHVFGIADAAPADTLNDGGAMEFTVPEMNAFAVIDLTR